MTTADCDAVKASAMALYVWAWTRLPVASIKMTWMALPAGFGAAGWADVAGMAVLAAGAAVPVAARAEVGAAAGPEATLPPPQAASNGVQASAIPPRMARRRMARRLSRR